MGGLKMANLGRQADSVVPRGAWTIVVILSLLWAVSVIDRFALALLAEEVMRDLSLSDSQMGLLLGAGFAVVYALSGLPLAQLIDTRNRRNVVVAGVALWTVSTLTSAFVHDFWTLAVCRTGIAVGEAVLSPAAVSIIADLFPRERRSLPLSVYTAVGNAMTTGAFAVIGVAYLVGTHFESSTGFTAWRATLAIVAVPGMILALFLSQTREAPRTEHVQVDSASFSAFLAFLKRHWRFFLPFYVGISLSVMFAYALLSWLPTLLVRQFDVAISQAGFLIAAVGAPCGVIGTFLFPFLAARSEKKHPDGIVRIFVLALLAAAPFMIFAPLASSVELVLAGAGIIIALLSTSGTLGPLAMQSYGPPPMRARLAALSIMASSMIGFSVGPLLVALVSERFPGDPAGISYGMAVVGLLASLSGLFMALSMKGARNLVAERDSAVLSA